MGVVEAFETIVAEPRFKERLTGVFHLPEQSGRFTDLGAPLHPRVTEWLKTLGKQGLYTHQAQAISTVLGGQDVMVTTGTGSGKSLCYNVPVAQTCLSEPVATALYIFPTKALAQDQSAVLQAIFEGTNIRVGVYDGDTPKSQRSAIRKSASIVVTNPDMLHVGILPQHEMWSRFFRSLRMIVVDEAHVYSGLFGSHAANVVRRLLRVCGQYRCEPRIVACSATIAEPQRHFSRLTGREAIVVSEDGAPKSGRYIAFLDAPQEGAQEGFSPNKDTAAILAKLCAAGYRTMAFCRSRPATEIVVRYANRELDSLGAVGVRIDSYRGGYTAKERRQIEKDLFKGRLMGLATTSAMELGVDIGGLDAVVMNGYPGRASSFWQQAGRAGRGESPGLCVMVAHEDPLEQFLARDPARIVYGGTERIALGPQNPQVLAAHLACAAYERPLSQEDLCLFGGRATAVSQSLKESGELVESAGRLFLPSHVAPAGRVNIRGSGAETVALTCEGETVGEMELWRALQSAHEGAVYMHRSQTYVVESLDLESLTAILRAASPDYFTQPVCQSVVQPTVILEETELGGGSISLCGVRVTTVVQGFRKIALDSRQVLQESPLDLPPQKYESVGVKVAFGALDDPERAVGGTHGAEHALLALAPLLASCDRRDLGSAWYSADPDGFEPSVYVFDAVPGGVGLCEALYAAREEWAAMAARLVADCKCEDGCPACLLSSGCECSNENLDKAASARILQSLCTPHPDR